MILYNAKLKYNEIKIVVTTLIEKSLKFTHFAFILLSKIVVIAKNANPMKGLY